MKTLITLFVLCMLAIAMQAKAADSGEYRLGTGDVLKISVYDHPELEKEIQVSQEGTITYPMIGTVSVKGKTFSEAEALIAKKLVDGDFIKKPNVNILVSQYKSQMVSVVGEVNHPGRFPLDSSINVVDLLALAGGISVNGGDRIFLVRDNQRTEILLPRLVSGGDGAAVLDTKLKNGDVIYVPRMAMVYVYGDVNRAGGFRLEQNMSVMQALSLAGGYTTRASHSSLVVTRTSADGKVTRMDAKPDDHLQENDVVFVPESIF
ncbi:polysaccharide export outer membrane protein [Silvimonas terrae]|uniref:Polysaccharide export outer membrane protein n=1 Tax=Silvimonas terrae TaxID=300266 RepID=A0A840RBJ4_9NEIS|nr:polysaccharide biosynthesis/export family protein [Silvimonas terrae]MBB5190809.1 polysaccharide export outer membrane protein [Silvimonas terrae]